MKIDVIGNNTLLVYTNDNIIFGQSKAELIISTFKLLENSRKWDYELMKIKQST